jgi:isoquinoline 1-oxidoreductase beta subunit
LLGYDDSAARTMRGVIDVLPVTGGLAVVAENSWYAFQALEAIDYDWAEAPYPQEQADHWAAVEASFTPDALEKVWRETGDPEAYETTDLRFAYRAPYVAHQPLEPLNAVARVTDESAEIWTAHQMPRLVQSRVAKLAGLEADQVVVHIQVAGGSFGHRLEFEVVDRVVEIARAHPGRHVKLTFSREEDFAQDHPRQIAAARASGAVEAGRVVAFDLEIAAPSPMRSQMGRIGLPMPGSDMQIVAGAWNMPYDIPTLRVRGYAVPELAPISSWRSVGASTAGFFSESALDELIHAAGGDPMSERLRMVKDPVARAVLEAVAEMSGWGVPMPAGRGRGVALVTSFGVPVAEVVEVTQTDGGIKIDRVFVAADAGIVLDPVNFENQVQGGVIWGLGHAINCEITYAGGRAEQSNYYDAEGMRLHQCPEIFVRALENADTVRGIGEPPVPPAAPALANAIFAATGQRLREMPFFHSIDFV